MTLIQLRSVDKFYGGRAVLRGLEMKVNPGARLGLVGGNGAGKSTMLRILAGLEEVDGGRRSGAGAWASLTSPTSTRRAGSGWRP
jgi:ABC-type sugar transport system ATPase subunit